MLELLAIFGDVDELRPEYRREDFGVMVRGKYVSAMREFLEIAGIQP